MRLIYLLVALLISIQFGAQPGKQFINPCKPLKSLGHCHADVTWGTKKTIFIPGQAPSNAKPGLIGKVYCGVQLIQDYENIRLAPGPCGATFNKFTDINPYITNYQPDYSDTLREVKSNYRQDKSSPVNTTAGELLLPYILIEADFMGEMK